MTAPYKTPAEVAHFERFNKWPSAACWLHPCEFTNTPEAEQERERFEERLRAQTRAEDAHGPRDGVLVAEVVGHRRNVVARYAKITVDYPVLVGRGVDYSLDVPRVDTIARGLLALARMGAR